MQKSIEVLKIICYTDFGEFNNCANVERSVSCANKKIVVALFLTALLIVCSFVDARGNNQPVSLQSNLAETLVDTRDADPTFDAHEAMSEDIWRQLESASKEAVVAYDGLTGEITITEIAGTYSETAENEPHIPEEEEAAPLFLRKFALPDGKIPRPSGGFGCEYRF